MITIPMKEIALKSGLLHVLKDVGTISFTVDDLTQLYLKHPSCLHTSKKLARQFVYRNMQRMMKSGHMQRLKVTVRWPHYTLTPLFFSSRPATSLLVSVDNPPPTAPISSKLDPLSTLKKRLTTHQDEVLTAMGEMEEYEAICKEIPDLREIAQPRYNESRERCSRLLGRVKALESLLTEEAG